MPSNLFGLPTHVLLQHVVVVLLPLAVLAALLVAVSARFRRHWGPLVLVGTFLVSLAVPLTTQSGESLASRLPDSPVIAAHVQAGQRLLIPTALFGLCLFAVIALDLWRRAPGGPLSPSEEWVVERTPEGLWAGAPGWASGALGVARVALVLLSVAVLVFVIQAGHTGAHAVWSTYPNLQP
jgi:hypothetical protein